MQKNIGVLEPQSSLGFSSPQAFCPTAGLSSGQAVSAPIGIVLLGVGRWGSHLLRNILALPQARLVAVVETSPDRLDALAQNVDLERVTLTADWRSALQLPGVSAAIVATPAASHYPLIRYALEQGLHVLAEKPLTLSVTEAAELCYLATQQQRQLVVDHTYLFHPAVRRGQMAIRQGQLGELRYGYAARTHLGPVRQDVDALWDLAIHDIAIFNCWLNAMPIQVQAQGAAWLQPQAAHLSDLVWVKLTYPSGFQAFIHLCWSNPDKQRRLSIVGSEAALTFDELAANPLTLRQGRFEQLQQQFVPANLGDQVLELDAEEPLRSVCTHFLDCITHNMPSLISSGWIGTDLIRVLAALTQSLQQGGQPIAL